MYAIPNKAEKRALVSLTQRQATLLRLGLHELDATSALDELDEIIASLVAAFSPKEAHCEDCGRQYGNEHGFPDLVVPHDEWAKICPDGTGGLLCPSCLCKRAYDVGVICKAVFRSGPFVELETAQGGE